MTTAEVDALLGYIEFNLIAMAEQLDAKFKGKLDSQEINLIYDYAYDVLNEMESTLEDRVADTTVSR